MLMYNSRRSGRIKFHDLSDGVELYLLSYTLCFSSHSNKAMN